MKKSRLFCGKSSVDFPGDNIHKSESNSSPRTPTKDGVSSTQSHVQLSLNLRDIVCNNNHCQ